MFSSTRLSDHRCKGRVVNHRTLLVAAAITAISATSSLHGQGLQATEGPQNDDTAATVQQRETVLRVQPRAVDTRRPTARKRTPPPLDAIVPSAHQKKALGLDDFPYQAQDFASNERVFRGKPIHNPDNPTTTWQQFAYDIGASRQEPDGTWRDTKPTIDWSNPKNSDFYVYKKPVYAVSEGVIVEYTTAGAGGWVAVRVGSEASADASHAPVSNASASSNNGAAGQRHATRLRFDEVKGIAPVKTYGKPPTK